MKTEKESSLEELATNIVETFTKIIEVQDNVVKELEKNLKKTKESVKTSFNKGFNYGFITAVISCSILLLLKSFLFN